MDCRVGLAVLIPAGRKRAAKFTRPKAARCLSKTRLLDAPPSDLDTHETVDRKPGYLRG
jgi:hypothetical protein